MANETEVVEDAGRIGDYRVFRIDGREAFTSDSAWTARWADSGILIAYDMMCAVDATMERDKFAEAKRAAAQEGGR